MCFCWCRVLFYEYLSVLFGFVGVDGVTCFIYLMDLNCSFRIRLLMWLLFRTLVFIMSTFCSFGVMSRWPFVYTFEKFWKIQKYFYFSLGICVLSLMIDPMLPYYWVVCKWSLHVEISSRGCWSSFSWQSHLISWILYLSLLTLSSNFWVLLLRWHLNFSFCQICLLSSC